MTNLGSLDVDADKQGRHVQLFAVAVLQRHTAVTWADKERAQFMASCDQEGHRIMTRKKNPPSPKGHPPISPSEARSRCVNLQ